MITIFLAAGLVVVYILGALAEKYEEKYPILVDKIIKGVCILLIPLGIYVAIMTLTFLNPFR